jgi:hypothetical protein
MALKKRKPGIIVRKSEKRLKGMMKIDKSHDSPIEYGGFDNALTSKNFKTQIELCLQLNSEYNNALKIADIKSVNLREAEMNLSDMYARVLSGCVSKFGSDAEEITILGGTRKSERKKMKRKNKDNHKNK